jgi:predicted amidohydrolase
MKCRIALAQIDSALGDVKNSIVRHVEMIRRARAAGAQIVVFPELSLTGYSLKDATWDVALHPEDTGILAQLIAESDKISILAGGVEETREFGLCNSAFLFERGTLRIVHRKIYPPTYGMFEELRYFTPGKTVRAFDAAVGRLGVLICEDLWHLPLPYLLARDGATVIIGMAASPTRLAGEKDAVPIAGVNSDLHRAYARLLSSYIVFCNRVGFEDGVNFWGGSEVLDPSGATVVQAKLFDEDLVFADLDENEVRRARRFSRHYLDDDPNLTVRELRRIARGQQE